MRIFIELIVFWQVFCKWYQPKRYHMSGGRDAVPFRWFFRGCGCDLSQLRLRFFISAAAVFHSSVCGSSMVRFGSSELRFLSCGSRCGFCCGCGFRCGRFSNRNTESNIYCFQPILHEAASPRRPGGRSQYGSYFFHRIFTKLNHVTNWDVQSEAFGETASKFLFQCGCNSVLNKVMYQKSRQNNCKTRFSFLSSFFFQNHA